MGRFLSIKKTLEVCRDLGWLIGKVEIPGRRYSSGFVTPTDLFGFADLVAIVPGKTGTLYIQATAGSNVSSHVEKMLGEVGENVEAVLNAGNHVEMWCWVLRSPRGTKRKTRDAIRWEFRMEFEELVAERVEDFSEMKAALA